MKTNNKKQNRGFTILEAGLALFVVLVTVALLVALLIYMIQVGVAMMPYLAIIGAFVVLWLILKNTLFKKG